MKTTKTNLQTAYDLLTHALDIPQPIVLISIIGDKNDKHIEDKLAGKIKSGFDKVTDVSKKCFKDSFSFVKDKKR